MKIFIVLITTFAFFISCNQKADSDKNYEKTKETLEQSEQKNPIKFIAVQGDKKKNIIGQTVVKASVTNNAKIVTYKDIDVKISFYSKTGTLLEEDHETIYENITPGNTVDFKSKFRTPKGSDSVAFKVVEAKF